jgi:plastocyanin domain-containing protein
MRALYMLNIIALLGGAGCSKATPASSGLVEVLADGEGFHPAEVAVQKGVPLTLAFKRTSDKTCATEVVFPELKLEKKLPLNEAVAIAIPTDEGRTLTFQCGMGMYKSKVVVR